MKRLELRCYDEQGFYSLVGLRVALREGERLITIVDNMRISLHVGMSTPQTTTQVEDTKEARDIRIACLGDAMTLAKDACVFDGATIADCAKHLYLFLTTPIPAITKEA